MGIPRIPWRHVETTRDGELVQLFLDSLSGSEFAAKNRHAIPERRTIWRLRLSWRYWGVQNQRKKVMILGEYRETLYTSGAHVG